MRRKILDSQAVDATGDVLQAADAREEREEAAKDLDALRKCFVNGTFPVGTTFSLGVQITYTDDEGNPHMVWMKAEKDPEVVGEGDKNKK